MTDDVAPTAQGLLRCLQSLAEEAAFLNLARTVAALDEAIAACREEAARTQSGARSPLLAGLVH